MDVTLSSSEKGKRGFHQIANRVHMKMYRKAIPLIQERVMDIFDYAG